MSTDNYLLHKRFDGKRGGWSQEKEGKDTYPSPAAPGVGCDFVSCPCLLFFSLLLVTNFEKDRLFFNSVLSQCLVSVYSHANWLNCCFTDSIARRKEEEDKNSRLQGEAGKFILNSSGCYFYFLPVFVSLSWIASLPAVLHQEDEKETDSLTIITK